MQILSISLCLIFIFVIYMHNNPDKYASLMKWLHVRTKYLRPEVSVVELIILACVLLIIVKLFWL